VTAGSVSNRRPETVTLRDIRVGDAHMRPFSAVSAAASFRAGDSRGIVDVAL
jgi:hypothetical protein